MSMRLICGLLTLALDVPMVASAAHADPVACQRAIAKESSRYLQSRVKALQSCEDKKAGGRLPASTVCTADPSTSARLQKAHGNLLAHIAKSCGGGDRTCGTADDESLASIGWDGVGACPNFESGSCNNPIANCSDIGTCVGCVADAASNQAMNLYYADLAQAQFGTNSTLNKCQRAIGRESTKFLRAKSQALVRCWDARLRGIHSNPCPVPGDGKAGPSIQKAAAKAHDAICKRCGGAGTCGSSGDLAPSDIGFTPQCPAVTVPAGAACGASVGVLTDLVACVGCVTEFKVDCTDALAVPSLEAYPGECNPTTTTTSTPSTTSTSNTTTPTSTVTTTTIFTSTTTTLPACPRAAAPVGQLLFTIGTGSTDCGSPSNGVPPTPPFSGEIDDAGGTKIADLGAGCLYLGAGFGGEFPPSRLPDGAKSVLDVSTISGTSVVLAGSAGTGQSDCTRAAGPAKHCVNGAPGTDGHHACTVDTDCGHSKGTCDFDANCIFGPPIPVPVESLPNLSVCIVNVVTADVCGSADLASGGTTTLSADLGPRIYLTDDGVESPCPKCVSGTCTTGDRRGQPCSGGVGSGGTTIECPPTSARFIGRLSVSLSPLSTGTTSSTADASGFFCPGQANAGAFGLIDAATIRETGSPLLGGGLLNPFATTLAGTFCVQKTGNPALDIIADLPGPGAVSIPGTAMLSTGLLP